MPRAWTRLAWMVVGCGWLALVAWLSLVPSPPGANVFPTDLGHLVAYAWLTLWFAQLRNDHRGRVGIAVAVCTYGVLMELLQGFAAPRDPSLLDAAINAIGAAAGLTLMRTRLSTVLETLEQRLDAVVLRRTR